MDIFRDVTLRWFRVQELFDMMVVVEVAVVMSIIQDLYL